MQEKAGIVTALEVCAWIIIVVGVIGGLIFLGTQGWQETGTYFKTQKAINPVAIGTGIGIIWGSIVTGIIMLALARITHTLDIQTTGKEGTTKRCPDCAGLIPIEARVCKFCGYRFTVDYFQLGQEYEEKGMIPEAITMYKRAIEDNPNNAEAHNNLAILYEEIGEREKAVEEYKKAIEINSSFAEAFYNLGDLYEKMEKHKEAIKAYKEYVRLNPEGEDVDEVKEKIEQLERTELRKKDKQNNKRCSKSKACL